MMYMLSTAFTITVSMETCARSGSFVALREETGCHCLEHCRMEIKTTSRLVGGIESKRDENSATKD